MTYAIGLLSGTSVDSIDVVLADFEQAIPKIIAIHSHPFPGKLQTELKQLSVNTIHGSPELLDIMRLHGELAIVFADAVNTLLEQTHVPKTAICGIGFHGQTIGHHPDSDFAWSLQLGDANRISLLTGLPVVSGFRSMDIAAGGQGAPLAPLLHREIFNPAQSGIAVVNIGGIANISLPDGSGYDTGPGNCLLDLWIHKYQKKSYDRNGQWAASGTVINELLEACLHDPYFQQASPKSTGTDYFNLNWLTGIASLEQYRSVDIQTTLSALTAHTITAAAACDKFNLKHILVCGGGAQNTDLMQRMQSLLPDCPIESTEVAGVDPDWVEGLLFAWLGWRRLHNQPVDTTAITGAEKPLLLGAIYQAVQ